jgi:hypothetical protein
VTAQLKVCGLVHNAHSAAADLADDAVMGHSPTGWEGVAISTNGRPVSMRGQPQAKYFSTAESSISQQRGKASFISPFLLELSARLLQLLVLGLGLLQMGMSGSASFHRAKKSW